MDETTIETTVILIAEDQYNRLVEGLQAVNNNLYFVTGVLVVFMVVFLMWHVLSMLFKRAFD